MHSNSVANPVLARRLAGNGRPYTRNEFHEWYGDAGERHWANASEIRFGSWKNTEYVGSDKEPIRFKLATSI